MTDGGVGLGEKRSKRGNKELVRKSKYSLIYDETLHKLIEESWRVWGSEDIVHG